MRVEDKALEGLELERAQRLEVEDAKQAEAELPVLAGEEVRDLELEHRGRLFAAIQRILAREQLTVSLLHLPQREANALEFLQSAVTGRSVNLGEFIYAEDRSAMLEQALAVLQQNLTHGSSAELAALHAKFEALTSQVSELRGQLHDLEDAQDDLIEQKARPEKAETDASDDPDHDDADEQVTEPEADDSLSGFIASALHALATVGGDAAAEIERPRPRSTLFDPDEEPGKHG